MATISKKAAFELGVQHGSEMANESGSNQAGSEGWDGMLINADPSYVREVFGWDGIDSSDEAKELLAEYCRGCQSGADEAVGSNDKDSGIKNSDAYNTGFEAASQGEPRTANPYAKGTWDSNAWFAGWDAQ